MAADTHREFKNRLYAQFARVGKALASPHRLELLELLGQGERSVDSLAAEIGVSIANVSQHLRALRQAALVESRKERQFVHYRLADPAISELCRAVRTVSEDRLAELDRLVRNHFGDRSSPQPVSMQELIRRARSADVVIVDTRPVSEYQAGHIAGAISVPVDDLRRRLKELPKDKEYVPIAAARTACTRTRPSSSCRPGDDGPAACWRDFRNGVRPDCRLKRVLRPAPLLRGDEP
jgi:DNA-binding transcriptional ArsR family regulator